MCKNCSRAGPDKKGKDRGNVPASKSPAPSQQTRVGSAFDHDTAQPGAVQTAVPAVVILDQTWHARGTRLHLQVLGQPDSGERRRYLERLLFTGDQVDDDRVIEDRATEDQA